MTVHDAKSMDLYTDAGGKLWRCVGTCSEPTVYMEEVEPRPNGVMTFAEKQRVSGGVTGLMWTNWKRIYRPEEQSGKSLGEHIADICDRDRDPLR